jgi:type I restriction enzyme, S subunit
MKSVALGEVADFIRGITFKPQDVVPLGTTDSVACIRTKNVQQELDLSDVWAVPKSFVKNSDKFVQAGDIVVSTANSWNLVGKCSWIPRLGYETTVGGFVCLLRAKSHVLEPRYLYHWMIRKQTQACLRVCARQTTNISNLSIEQAEELKLRLPPLEEQKRIAAILDQVDSLRRLRQRAIDRLNALGQAIFYEMFGDPGINPEGWELLTIGDLASSTQYGTSSKAGAQGEYPILRMNNLTYDGKINLNDLKYIDLDGKEIEKYSVVDGDVLFNRTNSAELVGKTAVYRGKDRLAFAGYLVRLRTNDRAVPDYISGFLNCHYGKMLLRGMCKSIIGMANINAKELCCIEIPVPPVVLQERYAERIAELSVSESPLHTHLRSLVALFSSLQHRAFRGEL